MKSDIKRKSIFWDIFWTVMTFGLFNLWVQIRQIEDTNDLLGRDEYSMWKLVLLTLITLGLYFVWHEYKMTRDIYRTVHGVEGKDVAFWCAVAAFFGLWFVVDSYQQSLLNLWISKNQVS
jgi:uncharacterized membrane protein YjgN (DUF898 family)